MKILALDSSGLVASVAIMEDDNLVAEYTMNYKKTHSQTLLPMLDELKKAVQLDLESIDAIAVAAGPGSFTGLRIGSATAKGLGLALNKPLIGIPTTEALAYNLYGTDEDTLICPIMDARRNQVYTGLYCFQKGQLQTVKERDALPVDTLLEELNQMGKKVIFLGDGVPVFREKIQEMCQVPYLFCAGSCKPSAGRSCGCSWSNLLWPGKNRERQRTSAGLSSGISGRKGTGRTPEEESGCLVSGRCRRKILQK